MKMELQLLNMKPSLKKNYKKNIHQELFIEDKNLKQQKTIPLKP